MILHGLEIRPCPGCEVELPVNPLNILVFARRLRQVRTRRCERGNIQRCCSSHFGHALRIRKTSGKIGMRVLLVMLMCPVFPAGILGSSPGLLMHPGAVTGWRVIIRHHHSQGRRTCGRRGNQRFGQGTLPQGGQFDSPHRAAPTRAP